MKRYESACVQFVSLNRIGAFKNLKDKLHKCQVAIMGSDGKGVKFNTLVTLQYAIVEIKSSHCVEQDL